MWSKYIYQIMYGEILDFRCQHQYYNGQIKGPVRKLDFAENLLLQLFRATVAKADTVSIKSLHTF